MSAEIQDFIIIDIWINRWSNIYTHLIYLLGYDLWTICNNTRDVMSFYWRELN